MESQFPAPLLQAIEDAGVIAVLVIDDPSDAIPVADALLDGGVRCMELTLRTPGALDALLAVRERLPDMIAGIGTVLSTRQVELICQAQATFAVAPGVNPRVIQAAAHRQLPFAPGVVTPSDMEIALEHGCRELKFFPAEVSGGLPYLRSMAAPYLHLGCRFVPLGGIHQGNLAEYLSDPLILAVGGSWIAPRAAIAERDWTGIRQRAQAARDVVDQLRQ